MTITQDYMAALAKSPCPSIKELQALCTVLHAKMVEADDAGDNSLLWLDFSFEDMSDRLCNAERCAAPTYDDLGGMAA